MVSCEALDGTFCSEQKKARAKLQAMKLAILVMVMGCVALVEVVALV